MNKKIITICRSFGAEGHEIGKELSERLQIPLYDKDLLDIAARKSNLELNHAATLDEQISKKIISHYFLMSQDIESDRLFREETHLILQLAERGPCIIVGRMADYILRERTDCFKVFITAPYAIRTEIIRGKYGISAEEAGKTVRKMDTAREEFYRYYSNGKWRQETDKDMVLNRGLFGIRDCVDILEYVWKKDLESGFAD